jgi:hypothetical protein
MRLFVHQKACRSRPGLVWEKTDHLYINEKFDLTQHFLLPRAGTIPIFTSGCLAGDEWRGDLVMLLSAGVIRGAGSVGDEPRSPTPALVAGLGDLYC